MHTCRRICVNTSWKRVSLNVSHWEWHALNRSRAAISDEGHGRHCSVPESDSQCHGNHKWSHYLVFRLIGACAWWSHFHRCFFCDWVAVERVHNVWRDLHSIACYPIYSGAAHGSDWIAVERVRNLRHDRAQDQTLYNHSSCKKRTKRLLNHSHKILE